MRRRWAVLLAVVAVVPTGCGGTFVAEAGVPECEASGELVAIAQAVPTARFVPCIEDFPVGWTFGGMDVRKGRASFWLDNDRVGPHSVQVTLEEACDTTGATALPPLGRGAQRSLRVDELDARSRGAWLHQYNGGCVTWDFEVPSGVYDFDAFNVELETALDFFPRSSIADEVRRRYGADLDVTAGA